MRVDVFEYLDRLLFRQRFAVVVRVAAQQMDDGMSLDRPGNDDTRTIFRCRGSVERGKQLIEVVTVDFLSEPAKGLEFRPQRSKV